jgi:hypothetical protein
LFSIGAVLITAGLVAILAWGDALRDSTGRRPRIRSAAAAIAMLGLLAVGLIATG